ncbi:hypothetical protein [Desulfosporosinus sp. Sb-LF]|uniref:hypothetical protein n=1 Tax=Desulfosporosinus sp. Sb-LF TaxID=2560027 RepID=UPI00107F9715|nr:hypothetical protein [Desulfosporosinus sp. Sb-LF]TGE33040.1 hypothetical protein E4K68_09385 [Desulfosporosinus sp. Sb-LF]
MKKRNLFLLLILIVVSSTVFFKVGYTESGKTMVNVFESSKFIFNNQLLTQSNNKFALLTDSDVENLGGNRYKVASYVDFKNDNQQGKRIWFTMIVHWNGNAYDMENLTTKGI